MQTKLKLAILGGASTNTAEVFEYIIKHYDDLKFTEVVLIDLKTSEERLDIMTNFIQRMLKHHNIPISVTSSLNQRHGLLDADFVLIQIRVGHMQARFYDETIPAEFNMLGHESVGIGGLFNALRTVPVIYEMIEDIKELAPKAWVINATNPTGIISEAVCRFSEFDRYIGLSNEPNQITKEVIDKLKAHPNELVPYYAGLSELSFMLKVYHKGKDKLPKLLSDGFLPKNHPMALENLQRLGCYPHPNLKYYYQDEVVTKTFLDNQKNKKILTNQMIEINDLLYKKYADENTLNVFKDMQKRLGRSFAQSAVEIMDAIKNNKKNYHVIHTVNHGHIVGIPDETSIEITARITKNGPIPVHIGELPLHVRGIVQHLKAYEELLCDAIYEKDLNKALLAFQIHPLSKSFKSTKDAFNALYEKHKEYLTYYGVYNK